MRRCIRLRSGTRSGALVGFARTALAILLAFACTSGGTAHAAVRIIGSGIVRVRYDERNERVARHVLSVADKRLPQLANELSVRNTEPVPIDVVDDLRPYRHAFRENLPVWGVAFTVLETGKVVVDVRRAVGEWNELERVLAHELSHVLLARRARGVAMPVWFLEGVARWQSGEWSVVDSWQLMNAVSGGRAPKLWEIETRYPAGADRARTAYRLSYRAVQALFEGDFARLNVFLDAAVAGGEGGFDSAFPEVFGVSRRAWMEAFHDDLDRRYHSVFLVFQTGPLFGILTILFLFAIARYQIRKRRKLKQLEQSAEGLSLDGHSDRGV